MQALLALFSATEWFRHQTSLMTFTAATTVTAPSGTQSSGSPAYWPRFVRVNAVGGDLCVETAPGVAATAGSPIYIPAGSHEIIQLPKPRESQPSISIYPASGSSTTGSVGWGR